MKKALCAIGLGSNLGDSKKILNSAVSQIQSISQIELFKVSDWYKTRPIGPPQPDYINGCATFSTSLSPWQLLDILQSIENDFGRERQVHWGARTLDLDILLYGSWQIHTDRLKIPHPYMVERGFVLMPLAEIAGSWLCDTSSISDLQKKVDCSDIVRILK